jgi:hypothetical protein
MSNNKNGAEFIDSRTKELSEMYDYLADLFLELLHKSTWSHMEHKVIKNKICFIYYRF